MHVNSFHDDGEPQIPPKNVGGRIASQAHLLRASTKKPPIGKPNYIHKSVK
jgi:hypothetical protein